jgi:hypothetical protein
MHVAKLEINIRSASAMN